MTDAATVDLIVIGGGPGGATLATLTAMQGHRVLLLEKEHFPRHQIGESLLPATIHGILPILGLRDAVAGAGFPRKNGGTFRWGTSPEPWTFRFARRADDPYGYAYQVERSRFDAMLLDNARQKGVEVREGHTLSELIHEGERVVGAVFTDERGRSHAVHARYVVDSSGNRSTTASLVGERVYSKFFQNVALYAYYENGKRLPAPNSGNILCAAFKDGWFWYIPLSDRLTSVGAVVSKEAAATIRQGHAEAMSAYIDQCAIIKEYLAPARRVSDGLYGEYRLRKDYSYCNTRFWKPGLALVGDAACFIDPVFSSGVHLATYSALLAARSINTALRGGDGLDEAQLFGEFERRYRREFGKFYQFLIAFYDMHQDEGSYFWSARKILNTEEKTNDAFIRLVAGISAGDEPLFHGGAEQFFHARAGFGDWFSDMLAGSAQVSGRAEPAREMPAAMDPAEFDPALFMAGFNSEIANLQLQARLGARRPAEQPLAPDGLIPSPDGLHWCAART